MVVGSNQSVVVGSNQSVVVGSNQLVPVSAKRRYLREVGQVARYWRRLGLGCGTKSSQQGSGTE